MPGFKPLNIESEDESDIEIDDTKELQIEEALKLYQTALKYHAEGPESFHLAAKAYEELFRSDIFTYPESQNELRRIELYGTVAETDDLWLDDILPGTVGGTTGLESGPSTLPQILHLSHKNYAQFKLEYLTARLDSLHVSLNQILSDATTAIDHFVDALDKDDSDLDLWRRTATVGDVLDSKRVARFCLEAVLDGDDEALGSVLALPGLDEGLAGEQLRRLIAQLDDQLSVFQNPPLNSKRKVISKLLKQRLDSYGAIRQRTRVLKQEQFSRTQHPSRVRLKAPATWAEVGHLILRQLLDEQHGTSTANPGTAIAFDIQPQPMSVVATPTQPLLPCQADHGPRLGFQLGLPESTSEQFPGLDDGQPTVQPRIACADTTMEALSGRCTLADITMTDVSTVALPTRKRSGDAAGLNDAGDEGRAKSKRTRVRESNLIEDSRQAIIDANIQWEYEQQINEIQAADDWMFETVGNLFERIGVVKFDVARNVSQELQSPAAAEPCQTNGINHDTESLKAAKSQIQSFLKTYSNDLAKVFLANGDGLDGQLFTPASGSGSTSNGAQSRASSKPVTLTNTGLAAFLKEVEDGWLLTQEVAWRWAQLLLRPSNATTPNTYREHVWPEDLKTMVVRTLVNFDERFLERAGDELAMWDQIGKQSQNTLVELCQTVFELHLDIYCLIKEPNSGVDAGTVVAQRDRLQRWSEMAREAVQLRSLAMPRTTLADDINVRFLWATTFHLAAASDVTQDHAIECMRNLRALLVEANHPCILLQNNAIMPEISLPALDTELSRLTTRDFFLKMTSRENKDPLVTIEMLEPLLTLLEDVTSDDPDTNDEIPAQSSVSPDLIHFLQSKDITVRMVLWQQLRDAYVSIDYKPMVVSCYLSMVRMSLAELKNPVLEHVSQNHRQSLVLQVLRLIADMTSKIWAIVVKDTDAFECVDAQGLRRNSDNVW